jgi:hypothetical protein
MKLEDCVLSAASFSSDNSMNLNRKDIRTPLFIAMTTMAVDIQWVPGTFSTRLKECETTRKRTYIENRVLRRIFGPKGEEVAGEDYMMRSFVTCTLHQITVLKSRWMRWERHLARVVE